MQAGNQKVLRACVVQRGRVIEEKRLGQREALSLGQAARNTFSISDAGLPASHTLFSTKAGYYELVLEEGMKGQISIDGTANPVDMQTLKAQGLLKKKGSQYTLPLNDKHRGKIVMGDITVIFQFVVPPPAPPAPRLPPAAKGTIAQQMDWAFAGILVASLIVHGAVTLYAVNAPQPEVVSLMETESRFAELIIPDKPKDKPKPKKPKDDKKGPKDDKNKQKTAKAEEDKPKEKKEREPPADKQEAKAQAQRKAKAREALAGKGILAILGSKTGSGSAVANVLAEGGVGGDLDSAFEGVAGVGVATAGGERTKRGGGTGEAASIGGLATKGGGKVGAGTKKKRRVASAKFSGVEADGSLDPSKITKVVKRGQKAIQACYEKQLKRDDGLAGKVEIEVVISEKGKVSEVVVTDDSVGSRELTSCIKSRVKRWRFPAPDDGEVSFVTSFIFASQG
jgi:TonB family protein